MPTNDGTALKGALERTNRALDVVDDMPSETAWIELRAASEAQHKAMVEAIAAEGIEYADE